jgi:hypothetical protein
MSKPTFEDRSIQQKDHRKAKKKNYVSPKLVEYGALAELTKTGVGSATDGHFTMRPGI